MNINSLYGNIGSSAAQNAATVSQPNAGASRMSSIPPANGAAATANISAAGQFFSQLQQLSQQDPTQFKAVAAQLATNFQTAASSASGPQAQFLTNLANTFTQAAQTGSLQPADGSQFAQAGQAPQSGQSAQAGQAGASVGTHHHHHHHGGGGGGEFTAQSSSVQQAFQSALSILNQAIGTTPATATSTSA